MTNIKKWTIAIAIAIVFNLFVNYGVATFSPGPEFSDFCGDGPRARPLIEGEFPILLDAGPFPANITIVKKFSSHCRIRFPLAMYITSATQSQLGVTPMDVPTNEKQIRQLWEKYATEAEALMREKSRGNDDD